jgi:hypothetical protein
MADLYCVRSVTPETKVYGVLGRNVLKSLSPVLHNRALEARGLVAVYAAAGGGLAPFIEALPALGLSGLGVTQPYKVEILPYLQEVEEPAACGQREHRGRARRDAAGPPRTARACWCSQEEDRREGKNAVIRGGRGGLGRRPRPDEQGRPRHAPRPT